MTMQDSIKQGILYYEQKVIEYENDVKNKTSGRVDYRRGKADTYRYLAIRLKRILEFHHDTG